MTQWIITSSVLIAIIAVLRFFLRGKISLKLQYALWGLVLIRLLIPFSIFESPASVLNFMQGREENYIPPAYSESYVPETITPAVSDENIFILDDNIEHIKPDTNIVIDENGFVTEPEIKVIDWNDVLKGVWLVGIAVFGTVFAVSNLRFRKKLKNTREYVPGTKAWLPVYESSAVKTPCLFGMIKPAIYVTKEVLENEKTLCHVLEHETTHYRHGDNVWSVLRCFCLALHWYNPLVWLAAFLSMRDSELACDEATIGRIGEGERIEYGRTLINLTCEKPAVGILSAATTMTGSKNSIKERIMLIAKKPKMLKITAVLVAVIAVFAVGCTFTGAVVYNPKTADVEVTESFSNRLEPELTGLDGVIRMAVNSASPEEITTEIYNGTSEEICYSTGYALHFEKDGKWYELDNIEETTDMIFSEVQTKFVSAESKSFWTNVSKESYGKLPDGKYRITRTVSFGEIDISENEFYVIAAEFILADGNFVDAGPIITETKFVASELIYRHSASSFYGFSEIRYEIPEWKWQEFPYTDEEWKNLFFAPGVFPFPDISQYEEKYYHPLDSLSFIAYLDGELWSVYLGPKKSTTPDDLWVWDIYRVVPAEENENASYQKSCYRIYSEEELSAMTEEEYRNAAKIMGYTDEQLEYISGFIEEGLGREYILMPLEYSKETSVFGKTDDGKKSLGTFYYDPENFGDYGGSLGFAYVINNGKFTVLPEMYFRNLGVVDNEHFAFANDVSIKIYEFENINKPSAEWNLPTEDNTEFGYQLLGTSMNKTAERIAVFYVDIPDDFDEIYDHKEPDLSSTYQIAVIDADGNEVYTFDTGINLMVEYQGLPDCVRPEMGITYKNTLRFTLGEKSYEFNFEEKSLEKISPVTNFDSNDERVKEAISYIEYIEEQRGNSIISVEFSAERTDLEIEYLARYYDKEMLKDNIIHIKATYLDDIGAEDWTSYVLSYTELEGPYSTENYSNKYREEFGTQWYIINSGKP